MWPNRKPQAFFNLRKFSQNISSQKKGPWMVLVLDNSLLAASEMLCTVQNYKQTDYELQNHTCKYFRSHGGYDKTQTNLVLLKLNLVNLVLVKKKECSWSLTRAKGGIFSRARKCVLAPNNPSCLHLILGDSLSGVKWARTSTKRAFDLCTRTSLWVYGALWWLFSPYTNRDYILAEKQKNKVTSEDIDEIALTVLKEETNTKFYFWCWNSRVYIL